MLELPNFDNSHWADDNSSILWKDIEKNKFYLLLFADLSIKQMSIHSATSYKYCTRTAISQVQFSTIIQMKLQVFLNNSS